MKRLAITLSCVLLAGTTHAQFVDLGESLFFIRSGFADAWTRALPRVDDEAWAVVPPTHGLRSMEMRSVGLPGVPSGSRFSFIPGAGQEFTVLVPFQADLTLLNASDPALFLKRIGQGWVVYLNGVLLRNELVKSGGGYVERSLRDVIVPLDKRRLRQGENVLAFRLWGDPTDNKTGFGSVAPYVIDSYRSLSSGNREYVDLMLIGIYVFFALYHGVLFALRPKDSGYLYFGGSTLLLAAFMFSRTNASASLIVDTSVLQRIEDISLFFSVPVIMAFLESMLNLRRSRFVMASAAFALALSIACLFLRSEPLSYLWLVSTVLSIGYLTVFTFSAALRRDYRGAGAKVASTGQKRSIPDLVSDLFVKSNSGSIAFGGLALGAAVVVDVMGSGLADGAMPLSRYVFFLFMLLMSGLLAARFARVSQRAEAMNFGLEAEVEAGTAALANATSERVRLNAEITAANVLLSEAMAESARDVQIAAIVQKGFFPKRPSVTSEWDIAYVFEPVSGISGDFYDFYEKAGNISGIVVGTVSGSGIAGGLITVLAKNVFSRGMQEMDECPVNATLVEINRRLIRELSVVGNTVSCTFMKLKGARVEYVNAAHTDALLRRAGRREVSVIRYKDRQRKSPPLGRDDFESGIGALRFDMAPGDTALLYTAGLVGSVDAKGIAYGIERLAEALGRADPENAESTLASVMIDFRNATAGAKRPDDITAIVLVRR